MSVVIKDGRGTGQEAQVDDHGRLYVLSNNVSHVQHHALYHQDLFVVFFTTTLPDTNETPCAFFKNTTGDLDMEVFLIDVGTSAASTIRFYFDAEYTSGGEVVTPLNTNRGSGNNLSIDQAEVYQGGAAGDLALDTTEQKQWDQAYTSGPDKLSFDLDGGLILSPGTSAHMTAQGAADDVVTLSAFVTSHPSGTRL